MHTPKRTKLATAAIAAGIIITGSIVTAPAAQAMTVRACYNRTIGGVNGAMQYEDYNWWEETFLGETDQWTWTPHLYCA